MSCAVRDIKTTTTKITWNIPIVLSKWAVSLCVGFFHRTLTVAGGTIVHIFIAAAATVRLIRQQQLFLEIKNNNNFKKWFYGAVELSTSIFLVSVKSNLGWLCFTSLRSRIGLNIRANFFETYQIQTTTSSDLTTCISSRFIQSSCLYFKISLAPSDISDWLTSLLWFSSWDTRINVNIWTTAHLPLP